MYFRCLLSPIFTQQIRRPLFKVRTDFGNALFPLKITWEEYSTFLHDLISKKILEKKAENRI